MDEELEQPCCPLITEYTDRLGISHELLEKLYVIRKWDIENTPVPFAWPSLLRKKIYDVKNQVETDEDLRIRNYQLQQIHHHTRLTRYINGEAVGLGKSLDSIAAFCWLKERYPDYKMIIATTKSTTWQWAEEVERFSYLKPYIMQDKYKGLKSSDARYQQLMQFLEGKKKDVMVIKYSSMIGTRKKIEGQFDEEGNVVRQGRERVSAEVKTFTSIIKAHKQKVVLVFDECQRFKNAGSSTRNLVFSLSHAAARIWALSATVIKNGMEEFYSIATAIGIQPFGSMGDFKERFCITRQQYIGKGRHKEVIVGYKNVAEFKSGMRPFFLGRSQKQVKEPLPQLSTVYHPVDLDEKQRKLLLEDIPNGTFTLPPSLIKVDGELYEKERDPDNQMTMLSVQQLVANHWALLDKDNEKEFHTKTLSSKEDALIDMLDGDYRGEKVIVFTKFKTFINRLEYLNQNGHLTDRKFLRVTGNENEKVRAKNKQLFQDPKSEYDAIYINAAGIEGINLQQASHMICLDLPWSLGDLIQLVGRMVRMASPHSACTLHIIVAKGTVDEYVIDTLKGKKGVFAKILGASHTAGLLDDQEFLDLESGMEDVKGEEEFKSMLKAFVRSIPMGDFIKGELIEAAHEDAQYQMSFDVGKKKKKRKQRSLKDEIGKHCDEIELL